MVEANANDLAILSVGIVHPGELLPFPSTQGKPYVAELGDEGTWDVLKVTVAGKVRHNPVQDGPSRQEHADECKVVFEFHDLRVDE